MFKYLKEYRFYIVLFLFVLIPIVSIDTATRSPRDYRFYDKVIVYITWPVQNLITVTLDTAVSAWQNYVHLRHVRGENLKLLDENRQLLNTIVNLRETQQENIRLRKLLNFKEHFDLEAVVARVVAKDVSTEFRTIRINRGTNAGIKKDMAVVNAEGIVGRVLRTTHNSAFIVTILDEYSAVDTISERSRVRGIVNGMKDEVCQLKFALRTDDIKPGDLLISSGLVGIFPKGIPVGRVSKVHRREYGITQRVEVRPAVDFSRLEEVMVITNSGNAPMHVNTRVQYPESRSLRNFIQSTDHIPFTLSSNLQIPIQARSSEFKPGPMPQEAEPAPVDEGEE